MGVGARGSNAEFAIAPGVREESGGRGVRNVYSVAGLNRFVLLTDFRTHSRLKNGQKLKTNSPSFSFIHWARVVLEKGFVRWKW